MTGIRLCLAGLFAAGGILPGVTHAQTTPLTLAQHAANFTSKDRYNPKFGPGRLAAREAFLAAGDRAVPVLERIAMAEGNGFFRADALVILSQIDGPVACAVLRKYLLTGSDYVYYQNHAMTLSGKRLAVRLLVKMKAPEAMPLLVGVLKGEGKVPVLVRSHVAEAFGDLGRATEVPQMVSLLSAEDVKIRRVVTEALGRLADPRAVPALRALANDRDNPVRTLAAVALGRIPTEAAVEALGDFARDRYTTVSLPAVRGLVRHRQSPRAVEILKARLKNARGRLLVEVVRALAHMGHRDGTAQLLVKDLATQTDRNTRRRAVEALGEVGGAEAVKTLLALLASKDADERYLAALALGKLKVAEGADALKTLARDVDANVRDAGAEALERIEGNRAALPESTLELPENAFTVFYGDSITGETIYRAQIRTAIVEGYPYETRWFDTRGQHGWSLTDVFKAPRDALIEWPDLLTTQYGMNDVGYASRPDYTQGIATYHSRYEHLLTVLATYRKNPVRRLLITATGGNPTLPVTPGYWGNVGETIPMKAAGGKAEILRREARAAIDLAGRMGVDVADINSPMRYRTRECLPRGLSHYVLGDGWHPSGYGGKVMALEVLKLIGHFPNVVGRASVNAATGRTTGVAGCRLLDVTSSGKRVRFTIESADRPILRRASDFEVFGVVRSTGPLRQGVALLALKVTGLAPGDYQVCVDGAAAKRFSHAGLAAGVRVHLDRDRAVELLAREQIQYLEQARGALVRPIEGSLAKLKRALRHTVEIVPADEEARERPTVNAAAVSDIYTVVREMDAAGPDASKAHALRWPIQHVLDTCSVIRVAPIYRGLEYGGPEVKLPITVFFSNVFHSPLTGSVEVEAPAGWEAKLDAKPFNNLPTEGWVSFGGSVAGTLDRTRVVQVLWGVAKLKTAGVAFERRHPLVMRSAALDVAGPFAARSLPPRMRALAKGAPGAPPPEPDPEKVRDGSAKGLTWSKVTSRVFQPRYVLTEALGYDPKVTKDVQGHTALVRLRFHSPEARECFMELSVSAEAYQAFLNDRDFGYLKSFTRQPVRLRKGTNVLLLRVFPSNRNIGRDLAVGFEFSDIDSTPFEDLTVVE